MSPPTVGGTYFHEATASAAARISARFVMRSPLWDRVVTRPTVRRGHPEREREVLALGCSATTAIKTSREATSSSE